MTTDITKPTTARKVISYTVMAAMLHASVAPAIASTAQKKQQEQAQAAQNKDDAVTQMIELAAKHKLNVEFIKETEAKQREGRNVFKRMVDGVIELFTDNSEEVALDEANDETSSQLLALETQAAKEHAELITELKQQKQTYQEKGFDAQSLQEQDQLIAEMNSRYKTLTGLMTKLKKAKSESAKDNALAALNKQLTDWQPKVAHTDMENLPWGTPKNDVREPVIAKQSDINKVSFQNHNHLNTAVGQWRETEYKIGNYLLNKQNPPQSPFKKGGGYFIQKANAGSLSGMTAAGNWAVLNALPKEVQPADLEANQDVQINDDIKALAKQLDHSPAKIYKWVHDNIEFVPTYGSIQGSAYTLDTKRGNSADTASLLIALLRASNVPARYVYGTVDIPAKFAMDWVGGVNNLDAAGNLIGQGGIPHTIVMNASVPKYLRMEHVWVEANVDYIGSRGALSADKTTNNMKQWIPLDASYKSYTRTQGIDLAKAVPFDAEKLLKDAQEGAEVNESEGSVKNLNQDAINQAIEDYQAQVQTYLEQNNPNATVGDVLGTSTINEYKSDTLAPMLPYQVKTVVSDYQELPANMRHYFLLRTYASTSSLYGTSVDYSSPIMDVKIPTTQLQGKPLAFSFKPANEAEEEKLTSLLPKDENGTLPSSLPTNISMTPELTLDGATIQSKGTHKLGHTVKMRYGMQSPNSSLPSTVNKDITAGEYHAIGYNLQGMSQKQLEQTKQTLENVKAKLEDYQANKNQAVLDGLTKHDLTGAILQANVQGYFAVNQEQDYLIKKKTKIIQNYYMSFGTFSTSFSTYDRYGIPWKTASKSFLMDIDRILHQTVSKDNNKTSVIDFLQSQGIRESANEHLVPEALINKVSETNNIEGISAVKALAIANQQGQNIFTITKENQDSILPKLSNHSARTLSDVRNALNAGKQITISKSPITYKSWKGAGYIVLDTINGTGAYLIEGGADGSDFLAFLTGLSQGMAFSAILIGGFAAGLSFAIFPILALCILTLAKMYSYKVFDSQSERNCTELGFDIGLILTSVIAAAKKFGLSAAIAELGAIYAYGLFKPKTAGASLECVI